MNSFHGYIANIEVSGNLSLVSVRVNSEILVKAIVIETPDTAPYLFVGNEVNVIFKETEVVIGLENNLDVSLQNRINGTITSIEKGDLISKVVLETIAGPIVSVISTEAISQLKLREGLSVTAMIKLNEIMLSV